MDHDTFFIWIGQLVRYFPIFVDCVRIVLRVLKIKKDKSSSIQNLVSFDSMKSIYCII